EPHQVDHGRAVFAGAQTDGFGIQIEFGRHAGEGAGRLHRVEICALDVLDQGDFEQAVLGDFAYDYRDRSDGGKFGRTPPALPSHQLVVAVDIADYQGLYDAVGADGLSEFFQAIVLED